MLSRKRLGFVKWHYFTSQEEVQCCYWIAEFKFPVTVQCKFCEKYVTHQTETQLCIGTSIFWNMDVSSGIGQVLCTLIYSRILLCHKYLMDTSFGKMGHLPITGHQSPNP
jgi:hypothetical protein